MARQPQQAYLKEYQAKLIIPEEDASLQRSAWSGGSGRYSGSAGFFAQIGKAFAEAMLDMQKK